jgi:hypothetical protein
MIIYKRSYKKSWIILSVNFYLKYIIHIILNVERRIIDLKKINNKKMML